MGSELDCGLLVSAQPARSLRPKPARVQKPSGACYSLPKTKARNMIFSAFDPYQIVDVTVDPRIREQEFGNLQGTPSAPASLAGCCC